MKPRATVVVHLDGERERALACLRALEGLDPSPAYEAIVVADAAPALGGLLAMLEGDVEVIRNERRRGLAASAALAAERAQGEILVVLRDAPKLEPAALRHLVEALADPALAGAACALPGSPDAHPVASHALALRGADAACLERAASAPGELQLAAICAELAATGRRVATVASVAHPPSARATSARRAPGERPEVTIVIPTLDARSARVRACLAAIEAATEAPHQVILVDNGSPPQGFTAPVNAGLRGVDTPYAVVMNDDVETLPGWWPPLREELDAGAAVAFPLTVEGGMRTDFAAWCFALSRAALEEMAHAPGRFFDPALRVWFQDTDLLERLRAVGNPPRLVRESRIRHGLSATVASEDTELRAWIERTIREDREAFGRKHPTAAVT